MVAADLLHKNVFLDSAPLIYFIEGHSEYQNALIPIFEANDKGNFRFITSSITLLEVLVKPMRENQLKIVEQYKKILSDAPGIEIFEISNIIAIKAAELRAKYNLRTPDALQIATAIENNADYFLTNDMRLKPVKEINSITLSDLR
jgi:predicted nucleic acid-binding protein